MRCAAIGPRLAALSAGPHGVTFRELVKRMVEHDIDLARGERTVNEAGFANSTETPPPQRATENMTSPMLFPLSKRILVAGHPGMVGRR